MDPNNTPTPPTDGDQGAGGDAGAWTPPANDGGQGTTPPPAGDGGAWTPPTDGGAMPPAGGDAGTPPAEPWTPPTEGGDAGAGDQNGMPPAPAA